MYWQYRTILFEYQKDGLLGDKYIDDEQLEKTLNDQGDSGWELIAVTPVQEGLLAFFKRMRSLNEDRSVGQEVQIQAPENTAGGPSRATRPAEKKIQPPEPRSLDAGKQAETSPGKKSRIGEIKIS